MDKENIKCKDCKYCNGDRIAKKQNGCYGYSRRLYYCENPEFYKIRDKIGYPIYNFIGFGDTTKESPLQLKSCKKWCPLKTKRERKRTQPNTTEQKKYIHSDSLYLEDPNEKEE